MHAGRWFDPSRFTRVYRSIADYLAANRSRWLLPIIGGASLVWFLLRVIPKPTRATYPCQRAAFPLASGFVVWLLGLAASTALARRAWGQFGRGRYAAAALGLVTVAAVLAATFIGSPTETAIAGAPGYIPEEEPNRPMGVARGIYPGRVVWVHNPAATPWDGNGGNWWSEGNTVGSEVEQMVSDALQTLTGKQTDAAAWSALFEHFNGNHGRGEAGYTPGERVAIKFNDAQFDTAPQTTVALIDQLVSKAGVPADLITIYDVPAGFPGPLVRAVHDRFPEVRFVAWENGGGVHQYVRDETVQIHWSQELTMEIGGGSDTFLPTCVTSADYLINLGNMKGHDLAGVTLCAKNHFGSISTNRDGSPYKLGPKGAGLHPYVTVHDYRFGGEWDFDPRPMGTYTPLVDLMGHEHLVFRRRNNCTKYI